MHRDMLMPSIKLPFIALLSGLLLANSASSADSIGVNVGIFNGVAIAYQKPLSDSLSVRLELTTMPFDSDFKQAGIEYDVEYERNNLGVLLDWEPFGDYFFLAGGIYAGEHNWKLEARPDGNSWEIGDRTYVSDDLKLRGQVSFSKSSPYLGLGIKKSGIAQRITLRLDLGLLYIGKGALSYSSSGTITEASSGITLDVHESAQFQQDLEGERASLEEEIEDYSLLPMTHVGIAYSF